MKNESVKWSDMQYADNLNDQTKVNTSLIDFDFTAKREAAGTLTPIRKGKRNKHLNVPAPAKLDRTTNFMLEVSNIAA